jgi:hypothetical protein
MPKMSKMPKLPKIMDLDRFKFLSFDIGIFF